MKKVECHWQHTALIEKGYRYRRYRGTRNEEKEPNALRRTTIQAAALAGSIISRRNNVRKDNLLEGIVRKSSHVVLYYYMWIIIFYCTTDDTNFFFNHQIDYAKCLYHVGMHCMIRCVIQYNVYVNQQRRRSRISTRGCRLHRAS